MSLLELEAGTEVAVDGLRGYWTFHGLDSHDPAVAWLYGGSRNPNGRRAWRAIAAHRVRPL